MGRLQCVVYETAVIAEYMEVEKCSLVPRFLPVFQWRSLGTRLESVHFSVYLMKSAVIAEYMEVEKCTLQWYFMKSAVRHLKLCLVGTLLWVLLLETNLQLCSYSFHHLQSKSGCMGK